MALAYFAGGVYLLDNLGEPVRSRWLEAWDDEIDALVVAVAVFVFVIWLRSLAILLSTDWNTRYCGWPALCLKERILQLCLAFFQVSQVAGNGLGMGMFSV